MLRKNIKKGTTSVCRKVSKKNKQLIKLLKAKKILKTKISMLEEENKKKQNKISFLEKEKNFLDVSNREILLERTKQKQLLGRHLSDTVLAGGMHLISREINSRIQWSNASSLTKYISSTTENASHDNLILSILGAVAMAWEKTDGIINYKSLSSEHELKPVRNYLVAPRSENAGRMVISMGVRISGKKVIEMLDKTDLGKKTHEKFNTLPEFVQSGIRKVSILAATLCILNISKMFIFPTPSDKQNGFGDQKI